jgi:hypothetical protein
MLNDIKELADIFKMFSDFGCSVLLLVVIYLMMKREQKFRKINHAGVSEDS